MIDQDGGKKFLSGQVTKGAQAIFDGKGPDLVCEGYATALSVRRVMRLLGRPYRIRVAFSAGNLEVVAKIPCLVIADNDAAGLKAARASQNPFWASDVPGEDFNDVERRLGTEDLAVIFGRCLDAAVSHNLYKPLQKYS